MKHKCKCGNYFDDVDNMDGIDIQWTEANGCDKCKAMLPVEEKPKKEPFLVELGDRINETDLERKRRKSKERRLNRKRKRETT